MFDKPIKNKFAVALGRKGGLKTWSLLTAEQRAQKVSVMVKAKKRKLGL